MQSPAKRQKCPSCPCIVIAITGSSRSGKTTLARRLRERLQGEGVSVSMVEQDRHRQRSAQDRIVWGGKTRPTWEGPQFTNWAKLCGAVTTATTESGVVLVEGYLLLDAFEAHPPLGALFDGILFVSSTKEQVVSRRDSAPGGWDSKPQYAEHCVWPVHVAYQERVAAARVMEGAHSRAAYLPANDDEKARVQAALGLLGGWFPDEFGSGTATASSSTAAASPASAAAAVSSSSSSSSQLSVEQLQRSEANRHAALEIRRRKATTAASSSSSAPQPRGAAASSSSPSSLPPPAAPLAFAPTLDRRRPVVLVSHGSMNPVHLGHVAMMTRAKAALEACGFQVDSGVIGITRASHILAKGTAPMGDAERLRLLALATASHGWLSHCHGQGVAVTSARALAAKLKLQWAQRPCAVGQQLARTALAAIVEGSDVFARYPPRHDAFTDDGVLVVVPRGEREEVEATRRRDQLRGGAERVLVLPSDASVAAVSSTRVRMVRDAGDRAALVEMCGDAVANALLG